jgi:hypothetical protein
MPFYLTASAYGSMVRTERVPASKLTEAGGYERQRELLERAFPGWLLASPLDPYPRGAVECKVVAVFISPNKNGVGRMASDVKLWLAYMMPVKEGAL